MSDKVITFDDLTENQTACYNDVVKSLLKQKKHIILEGSAGTGKTTTTKFILDELRRKGVNGIFIAAPTHQAKRIISKTTGYDAVTIHKILKISPSTYENVELFEQNGIPDLSECRILVLEEISMYDIKLKELIMASIPPFCTILGIGDREQLPPVQNNPNGDISPFFDDPKFNTTKLTEVIRSNAPIIQVATDIRNGKWIYNNVDETGHGVHDVDNINMFLRSYFDFVKTPEDFFENRLMAYKNSNVNALNDSVRKFIFKTKDPFIIGETLVMQKPLVRSMIIDGAKLDVMLLENGEYVKIERIQKINKTFTARDVKDSVEIEYYQIDVSSDESNVNTYINVIVEELYQNRLAWFLERVAGTYNEMKRSGARPSWDDFWIVRKWFQDVKHLPACTVHKSQGSTVDRSFVYTECISKADRNIRQKLLYVASTRARTDVYFY